MLSLLDSSGGRAPLFHVEVFARFEPLDLDDRVEIEGLVVRNGERDLERGRSRDRFGGTGHLSSDHDPVLESRRGPPASQDWQREINQHSCSGGMRVRSIDEDGERNFRQQSRYAADDADARRVSDLGGREGAE